MKLMFETMNDQTPENMKGVLRHFTVKRPYSIVAYENYSLQVGQANVTKERITLPVTIRSNDNKFHLFSVL